MADCRHNSDYVLSVAEMALSPSATEKRWSDLKSVMPSFPTIEHEKAAKSLWLGNTLHHANHLIWC